jgi:SAM-dependent methyltransferase
LGTLREGTLPDVAPLERLDAPFLSEWRRALRAPELERLLGEAEDRAPLQLDAVRLPLVRAWLDRREGPAARLASLFIYAAAIPVRDGAAALGERVLDGLLACGAVARSGDTLRARFRVTPLEGILFLSDPPDAGGDAVMGPGATTVTLMRLVPRGAGAVLDLGCGAGTLALVAAARGARRAVGVDVSARAVALARVNASLNGLAAEFRAGDLAAPVEGERFDLVLAQPPYVVAPPGLARTVYLHGGPRGDELALRFASAAAGALAPGGRAVLFFDAPSGGEPIHRRLRAALGRAPVDLAVLVTPGLAADTAAMWYASLEDGALGERYAEAVRSYLGHVEAAGIATFTRALAVLGAAPAPEGRYTVELPVGAEAKVGLERLDLWLAGLELAIAPEAALLAAAVRPAPGARLREERPAATPGAAPSRAVVFERDLATDREVSEAGAFLLGALAASASVAEAEARFAEAAGEEPAAVRKTVVGFVREALSRGILAPAPAAAAR